MPIQDLMPPLSAWIAALTSSSLVAAISFGIGVWFKARVEKGVQHQLDKKLESVRSDMRKDEEEFRAALRRSDEQIAALRSGALSGVAARHAALGKRRTDAVERVWAEAVEVGRFRFLSEMAGSINMDALMDRAAGGGSEAGKTRQFADTLLKSVGVEGPDSLKLGNAADKERPFVGPVAWSLFSAYRQLLIFPAIQMNMVKHGIGKDTLKDAPLLEPLRAAMPEFSDFIEKHKTRALPHLVQPLEGKLLAALADVLDGRESDERAVRQAAQVLDAVANLSAKVSEASAPKQ